MSDSKFDPADLPDISHLHEGERNRIRKGQFDERESPLRDAKTGLPVDSMFDHPPPIKPPETKPPTRFEDSDLAKGSFGQPPERDQEEFPGVFRDIQPPTERPQPDTDKPKRKPKPKAAANAGELDVSRRPSGIRKFVEEQRRAGRIFRSEEELNAALFAAMETKVERLITSASEPLSVSRERRESTVTERPQDKPHKTENEVSITKLVGAIMLAVAALYGFIAGAFQVAGVFSVLLAHSLIVIGWLAFMASVLLIERVLFLPRRKRLAVTASVGIISALFMFGMDRWMVSLKAQQQIQGEQSAQSSRKLLNKTPRQLLAIYERGNTPLQADQLMEPFKGEWIRVTGKVVQIAPGLQNEVILLLDVHDGDKKDRVVTSFDIQNPENKRKFLLLSPGDIITIQGRISRQQSGESLSLSEPEYIGP